MTTTSSITSGLAAIEDATVPEPGHTVRARITIRADASASVIVACASCREYPARSGYCVEIDHAGGAALIVLRSDVGETADQLLAAALDFVQRVPA